MKMMFKLTHMLGNKICDCELGSSADYVSSSAISLMKYQALTIFCQFMRSFIYLFRYFTPFNAKTLKSNCANKMCQKPRKLSI